MKKYLLLFCLFITSLATSFGYDGKLIQLKGSVKILKHKSFKIAVATQGMELNSGDVIKTEKGSLVHLEMPGGRIALIKENSRFKILSDAKKKHVNLEFDHGEFLIGVKRKLKKEESFTVRSPSAVVGVRGTLFWGLSDEKMTSTYACFESQITVLAGGIMLALNPGEKVVIPYGEQPGTVNPANVPLTYLDTFKINDSLQNLEDLLK